MKETEELYGHAFFLFSLALFDLFGFFFVYTFLGCWQEAGQTKKYLYV